MDEGNDKMGAAMDTFAETMIDTLIIIGNGFDIWQGIQTSYSDFEQYYLTHRKEIMKRLHISPITVQDENGNLREVSDVEIMYGDTFEPYDLDHDFWNCYEASLGEFDSVKINLYFGKEKEKLTRIRQLVRNTRKILQTAFSEWIASKNIEKTESGYRFSENCFVMNFNYTDTLEKRFGVDPLLECHIHGEATDEKSIIVGHAKHPELPLEELKRLGGRFEGLYYMEDALYETDKHVDDNWQSLAMEMAMAGGNPDNIKNVYVLGHSFSEADYGYFRHLAYALNKTDEDPYEGIPDWALRQLLACSDMDFLHLNMQYAIHNNDSYSSGIEKEQVLERAAVRARFLMEQSVRDMEYELEFMKLMAEEAGQLKQFRKLEKQIRKKTKFGLHEDREEIRSVLEARKQLSEETENNRKAPIWHISYYSEKDKKRIEDVMKSIHYTNYRLYPTINACIEKFKYDNTVCG